MTLTEERDSRQEAAIREFLDLYPNLEEAFEVLDITPEDAIAALLSDGLVVLPPFLQRDEYDDEQEEF